MTTSAILAFRQQWNISLYAVTLNVTHNGITVTDSRVVTRQSKGTGRLSGTAAIIKELVSWLYRVSTLRNDHG